MQVKLNIFFNNSHNRAMIDLIDECANDLKLQSHKVSKDRKYGVEISSLYITNKQEEKMTGFDKGDYVIITSPLTHFLDEECHDYIADILKKNLSRMMKDQNLKKGQKVLIVGLGNSKITSDALGIKTLDKIEISPFDKNNHIFKFMPSIFLTTGIDSFDMVHLLAIWLGVDYVILIDSLATTNIRRLGVSIQLNSAGLTPGSAVNHKNKKISKESLGIPCFAIGVPLMLLADKVIDNCPNELILSLKDIDENIDTLSYIISKAIKSVI